MTRAGVGLIVQPMLGRSAHLLSGENDGGVAPEVKGALGPVGTSDGGRELEVWLRWAIIVLVETMAQDQCVTWGDGT
jgi:hypothetical protein